MSNVTNKIWKNIRVWSPVAFCICDHYIYTPVQTALALAPRTAFYEHISTTSDHQWPFFQELNSAIAPHGNSHSLSHLTLILHARELELHSLQTARLCTHMDTKIDEPICKWDRQISTCVFAIFINLLGLFSKPFGISNTLHQLTDSFACEFALVSLWRHNFQNLTRTNWAIIANQASQCQLWPAVQPSTTILSISWVSMPTQNFYICKWGSLHFCNPWEFAQARKQLSGFPVQN